MTLKTPINIAFLCAQLLSPASVTLWTAALQGPLSMGSPRQEYWSRLPFPSPGDLPDPGMEPGSPALQAGSAAGLEWDQTSGVQGLREQPHREYGPGVAAVHAHVEPTL